MPFIVSTVLRSHSDRSSMACCLGSCFMPRSRPSLLKLFTFMSFSHSLNFSMRRSIVALASCSVFLSRTSLSPSLRCASGFKAMCHRN
jgi:hypothetical protein